jgi:hypothetical protein
MLVDYPLKNGVIGSAADDNSQGTVCRHKGKLVRLLQADLVCHQLC